MIKKILQYLDILNSLFISFITPKNWKKLKKKKEIIYDKARSAILKKYFFKKDYEILNVRIKQNYSLNYRIIFQLLFKLRLSQKSYKLEFIKQVSPKFIISMIDNNYGFYRLKNDFPAIKFILIQFAWRRKINERSIVPSNEINVKLKEINRLDYFLVFNDYLKIEFKKIIKANYISIGSFASNSFPIKKKKIKYKFLLIGHGTKKKLYNKMFEGTKWFQYFKEDWQLYKNLTNYLIEKGEKINILGKSLDFKEDIKFYNNLLGKNNYNYIPRDGYSYKIIDQSKFIFGSTSTLLYEALARGSRVGIFSVKAKNKIFKNTKFGWPAKVKVRGPFWTNSNSRNEIIRVIDFLLNTKEKKWKNVIKKNFSKILSYDNDNKKFRNISKKLKLPIKNKIQ